jgi:hypothetical protein
VVFNANGGSGTMAKQTIAYDASANLNANPYTKTGYALSHWNTMANDSGDRFEKQSSFTMNVEGDELYAQWTPIPVTAINFDNEKEIWNVGAMSYLGYTITPSDALNQNVTWHSDNPDVASVDAGGMVTANKVGIAHIKVTSNDTTNGVITDTMTLQIKDPTPQDPDTYRGDIVGTLLDNTGNPLVGYNVTLYSNPINTMTGADGSFVFGNVPYDHHTLVVSDGGNNEIGRFSLNFTQGRNNTQSIDPSTNTCDITFQSRTNSIDFDIQVNATFNDIDINKVMFTLTPVPKVVTNPDTGEWG